MERANDIGGKGFYRLAVTWTNKSLRSEVQNNLRLKTLKDSTNALLIPNIKPILFPTELQTQQAEEIWIGCWLQAHPAHNRSHSGKPEG